MLGRSGSWVGTSVAGSIRARFWFYQDFPAGSGPNLVISANENGTGGDPFDPANIVDTSAVVTDQDGNPIYADPAADPADLVKVDTQVNTAVLLNVAPDPSFGPVRVWYLYAVSSPGAPLDLEIAPRFVREVRSEYLDNRYLNNSLNLSDLTDATIARQNLGFTTQTAGRVLLGDGDTTFTSDADLFFDVGNTRLGLGTSAPEQLFHARSDTAPTFLLETQAAAVPDFRFQAARAGNANLANADNIGQLSFYGRRGGVTSVMAELFAEYTGDGTTRLADFVFRLSNGSAPNEVLRLTAAGAIRTQLDEGAAYIDANGDLTSITSVTDTEISYLDGVTSGIQAQLDGKQAAGNYITALTGDVTAAGPGSVAATIANDAVSNAKLANMATATFKGRTTAGTGDPEDLSATQATALLNAFTGDSGTGGLKGLVPAPAAGDAAANKFLSAAGTWQPLQRPKSSKVDLADGDLSKAVVFTTPLSGALALAYTPVVSFRDTVSTDPLYLPYTIIAQDENGFTVEWNDPIQGSNVDLLWGILIHDDP